MVSAQISFLDIQMRLAKHGILYENNKATEIWNWNKKMPENPVAKKQPITIFLIKSSLPFWITEYT